MKRAGHEYITYMSACSDRESQRLSPTVASCRSCNSNIDAIHFVLQNLSQHTPSYTCTASLRIWYTESQDVVMTFLYQDSPAWILGSELLGLGKLGRI